MPHVFVSPDPIRTTSRSPSAAPPPALFPRRDRPAPRLSLKLAERDIFRELTGFSPVLLLDDVLSELDPRRQEFVLNRISGGQVFITCCEEDRLETLLGGKVLHVENGKVV